MSNTDNFVVKSVVYDNKREDVTITSEDGREVVLELEGDCCSVSYFEENSITDLKSIVGETLVDIVSVESGKENTVESYEDDSFSEEIAYHALKISTNKQELVVDWRNKSNGWYDGWCNIKGWKKVEEFQFFGDIRYYN